MLPGLDLYSTYVDPADHLIAAAVGSTSDDLYDRSVYWYVPAVKPSDGVFYLGLLCGTYLLNIGQLFLRRLPVFDLPEISGLPRPHSPS